jgi:hypothetical protein
MCFLMSTSHYKFITKYFYQINIDTERGGTSLKWAWFFIYIFFLSLMEHITQNDTLYNYKKLHIICMLCVH